MNQPHLPTVFLEQYMQQNYERIRCQRLSKFEDKADV